MTGIFHKTYVFKTLKDQKYAFVKVVLNDSNKPIHVLIHNKINYKIGQRINISANYMVETKKTRQGTEYGILKHGDCNFRTYNLFFHRAEIVHVSKNKKRISIPAYIDNAASSTLIFLPNLENKNKGDFVEIPGDLKAIPFVEKYFSLTPGKCNFVIAEPFRRGMGGESDYWDSIGNDEDEHGDEDERFNRNYCPHCDESPCRCSEI